MRAPVFLSLDDIYCTYLIITTLVSVRSLQIAKRCVSLRHVLDKDYLRPRCSSLYYYLKVMLTAAWSIALPLLNSMSSSLLCFGVVFLSFPDTVWRLSGTVEDTLNVFIDAAGTPSSASEGRLSLVTSKQLSSCVGIWIEMKVWPLKHRTWPT